jgi:hypothetical protein
MGWVMGESGSVAGVVADGEGSVPGQTSAPAGVDVMVSLPGKSAGTGVDSAAGVGGDRGTGCCAGTEHSGNQFRPDNSNPNQSCSKQAAEEKDGMGFHY